MIHGSCDPLLSYSPFQLTDQCNMPQPCLNAYRVTDNARNDFTSAAEDMHPPSPTVSQRSSTDEVVTSVVGGENQRQVTC